MKKLGLIILIITTLTFSSTSYAEWKEVVRNESGSVFYINEKTIKNGVNTKYFYILVDYATPNSWGDLSAKAYIELNCSNMMSRHIILDFFRYPLGEGDPTEGSGQVDNPEWKYYEPDSAYGVLNKFVCDY